MPHLLAVLLTLAALTVASAPAQAAPAAPGSATRVGMTAAAYQAAYEQYTKAGMQLTSVSGYTRGGSVRYAATWRVQPGPPRAARHGLTRSGLGQELVAQQKAGRRPVAVESYTAKGKPRYAAIWEQGPGPETKVEISQTTSAFDATFDQLTKAGWRLRHLSAADVAGTPRYTSVWEQGAGPAWVAHSRLTPGQYQQRSTALAKQGFRLRSISGFRRAGRDRYAAVWEQTGGPAWRGRHHVKGSSFGRIFESERRAGWYPVAIDVFDAGGTPRVSWTSESAFSPADLGRLQAAASDAMQHSGVPGLSVAIAKEGRLLFAAGFGRADKERGIPMDALHRIRIGSTSKTITSAAVHDLVRRGALPSADVRVFGPGGVLASVSLRASMKGLQNATLAQFLAHVSGLPGEVRDPVDCAEGSLEARIARKLRDYALAAEKAGRSPLLGAPGERREYSNFSNIIAEAVIEKVTGRRYERALRAGVLARSGIWDARLFVVGPDLHNSGEARHYTADGEPHDWPVSGTCNDEPPGVGAGGWAMSAYDLARFLVHHDGRPQREALPAALHADMVREVQPTLSGPTNYARSWGTGSWGWCGLNRAIRQGHNGWLGGGWSDAFELDDGFQVVVAANGNGRPGACERLATRRFIEATQTIDWPEHDLFR